MALDYYRVLQVDPSAEPEVVQAAYRRLAAKYHPDVAQIPVDEADRRMKELNAAYAVLGNAESRAEYDHERPLTAGPASRRSGMRPRFRMEPAEVQIWNLDSAQRFAAVEVDVFQVEGDPAEWDFDITDFVLKGSFLRAFVESVETISRGHPTRVRIILDLGYLGRARGQSYFGSINVRGDPDARTALSIQFARRPGHVWATGARAAPATDLSASELPRTRRSRVLGWAVAPFRAQDSPARWLGIAGRLALVVGTTAILWIIAANIDAIVYAIFVVLLLAFVLVYVSTAPSGGKRRKKRKRR